MSHSISRTTATTATASARPDFADTSVVELIGDVTRDGIGRDQIRRVRAPRRTIETLKEIPHTLAAR